MADAVTSQILVDGPRNCVIKLTNISDGTGEAAVSKVIIANLSKYGAYTPTSVAIKSIDSDIQGMQVILLWKATTNVVAYTLAPGKYQANFRKDGFIQNNAGTGKTGDIALTAQNVSGVAAPAAGSTYTIILELIKKYN